MKSISKLPLALKKLSLQLLKAKLPVLLILNLSLPSVSTKNLPLVPVSDTSAFVLPSNIRPSKDHYIVAGQIFTMEGEVDKSLDHHTSLLEWTGFLSKAPKDKVIICQPHTDEVALMGELSAETLQLKGIKGYIVDKF